MLRSKIILLVLFLTSSFGVFAQGIDYNLKYDRAKVLLNNADYSSAIKEFQQLLNIDPANEKSAYTTYYYGLASYNAGDIEKAKDIFLQLNKNFSDWANITEVYLWLSKIHFELESPYQGLYYAELASANNKGKLASEEIKTTYLSRLDRITLHTLLNANTEEPLVADYLAQRLIELPVEARDNDLLDSLITTFNLDSAKLGLSIPEDVFKEQYNIAVMLPLFTERLWHSGIYLQKSFALELYEGIQMAVNDFNDSRLKISVFDTKMDSSITNNILASGQLTDMDAIIGPLYPDPLKLVAEYCRENKINFINPVSSNPDLIKHNPYGFLLRTGADNMGKLVAEFVKSRIDSGAFAVYYGPRPTDSLAAFNYSAIMQADSFHLAIRQKTRTENARQIFDSLTSSIEVVDTIKLQQMYDDGERVRFKPMRDSLRLKVDSIGHIFIASDNQAIASEVMSAITSRGDSSQIVGLGNWYSTPNASLAFMESLGVWLAMQEFENMLNPENLAISEKYRKLYHTKPSKYVFYGYHTMKFLGEALLNYGVYFQNGFNSKGNINPNYTFKNSQDNLELAFYKLQDGIPIRLRVVQKSE